MEGALAGTRVLDLTRVWSGPLAARILGDFGAEVIKIEHPVARGPARMPDIDPIRARFYPGNDPGRDPWNRNSAFNKLNRNKLGLTLDLANPAGLEVMRRLVAISDAVIENYSPRVMSNLGLGYDALSQVNPGIILVSMPGYGLDGPMRDRVAYGSTLDAESGVAALMGYEDGGPQRLGVALPDPVAGFHAVAGLLSALVGRTTTGRGQHIDLSQLESMAVFLGDAIVGYELTGDRRGRHGNRHPHIAPCGVYRSDGEDAWVSIAVETQQQWQALCHTIGRDDLAADGRFASAASRHAHHDEIDSLITAWTSGRSPRDAMDELQAAGVPAGAVLDAAGLHADPHLRERGFFVRLEHPSAGAHDYPGQPIRLSETPAIMHSDAPLLGQHNRTILGDLLGYSHDEIVAMEADGVIAQRPPV